METEFPLLVLVSIVLLPHRGQGYPSGPPDYLCGETSMKPSHGGNDFQSSPSPYSLHVLGCNGTSCRVRLNGSVEFKGLMLRAVGSAGNFIGTFDLGSSTAGIKSMCSGSAVAHSSRLQISELQTDWKSTLCGNVTFRATVVHDSSTFWNIRSDPYELTSPNCRDSTTSAPTTPSSGGTTMRHGGSTGGSKIDHIKACPANVSCFPCPDGRCTVTWSQGKENFVDFQVSAPVADDGKYLAVAFSKDDKMGNDSAVVCSKSSSTFMAEQWYTFRYGITKVSDPFEGLDNSSTTGLYSGGWMSCKFSRQIRNVTANPNPEVYNLDVAYHLMFATGPVNGGQPAKHDYRVVSAGQLNFTNFRSDDLVPAATTAPSGATTSTTDRSSSTSSFLCPDGKCSIKWSQGKENFVDFQVSAPVADDTKYLAVAFSTDQKMGDDSAVVCSKPSSTFMAEQWYTFRYGITKVSEPFEGLDNSSTTGLYSSGWLSCNFSKQIRNTATNPNPEVYNLDRPYYLMFATGPVSRGEPAKHDYRVVSTGQLNFLTSDTSAVGSSSTANSLTKAHGILMVIAWLMMASFSVLLPRYFKLAWADTKLFGKPIWFMGHMALMVLVLFLTAIAFIIIFSEVRGYVQSTDGPTLAHPPLGITIMILVFLNPVMALFRCNPDSRYRWIFNFFHAVVGEFVLVLAVVNIFLSFYMPRANVEHWAKWVMVAIICWHVVVELLLVCHERYLRSKSSRRREIRQDSGVMELEEPKGVNKTSMSLVKTVLILSQLSAVVALAIAICVAIGRG